MWSLPLLYLVSIIPIYIVKTDITLFLYFSLQDVTEPDALKNNIIDEVVDPKESLDKIEEGNIKLHTGNLYRAQFKI